MREALRIAAPDGVTLAASIRGKAGRTGAIFIHGILQSRLCWSSQFGDAALRGHRLVAYDIRGHGGSDKPETPAAYEGGTVWADELAAVIGAGGIRRPILVGWSFGGRIILEYLHRHGEAAIGGIVFVDAVTRMGPRYRSALSADLLGKAASDDLAEMIEGRLGFVRACTASPLPDAIRERDIASNALTPPSVLRMIAGQPLEHTNTLRAIRAPSMVVHGARDVLVPPVVAHDTAALIDGCELKFYDRSGHSPFAEEPARFGRDLAGFIARATG